METEVNIWATIALGVFSSILAAIILYGIQRFYKWGYKKDFKSHLDRAKAATWQIENLCGFPCDYGLVIGQVQELTKHVYGMYRSLYPLSLLPNRCWEKRLICTLLYDIRRVCNLSRFTTRGYDGEAEWEARLERLHKYFYKCEWFKEWNTSTVGIQLDLLEYLINVIPLKKALLKLSYVQVRDDKFWAEMEDTFIECGSFKEACADIVPLSDIGRSGLFRREYQDWLTEIKDGTPFKRCWRAKLFVKNAWGKIIKKAK
ncbi:MAG: hypothetical protein IJX22_04775, partial [Opitutales bacterium]|nr:hypothetical protein [Opitutales bacterium]